MFEYKAGKNVQLFRGDCLEIMPLLPVLTGQVDMVLTDIPYAEVNRKFVGIELDPDYFNICCKRMGAGE